MFLVFVLFGINLVAGNCIMYFIYFIQRTVTEEAYRPLLRGTEYEVNGVIPSYGAIPVVCFFFFFFH